MTPPIRSSSLLFAVLATAAFAAAQGTEKLTFGDTRKPLQWQGRIPSAAWAADGKHVEIAEMKTVVWFDPATGESRKKPANAAPVAAPLRKTAVVREGDVWLVETSAERPRRRPRNGDAPTADGVRVTSDGAGPGKKEEAHVGGDGSVVSFVRGNDLFVVDVATKDVWQVTADGGPELFHGLLDWVYQEELYGRGDFQGHWWSGNGKALAFLSLDESPVREFTVVDHVPEGFLERERGVQAEVTNYPKAGDPNPFARLTVAHRDGKKLVPVDLSSFPKDVLVVRVGWTPDDTRLLVTLQDRIQTWAELVAVDPATGAVTKWIREESPTWVNRPEPPTWLADGTFLWLSERTGYQHVYHFEQGGKLVRTVTAGEWQVRTIVRVDEARKLVWFEGTRDGATGRHLYRIGFDGQGLVCLTPGVGTHEFTLSADGAFVLDQWSAMDQPPVVQVLDGGTGAVVKEIGRSTAGDAAAKYAFAAKQRLTIAGRDGYPLDACVMLPPDWKEGQKYPVFLPTYSGPDAPTVRDEWRHSTYSQFLAQQGFVILQVNVRSASGRGQVHTGTCYKQLGVQELKDLEDAVDHVVAKFGGDPARVAISGWSYGGFMAAYALTHSTKFALGLAGAGVHDWQLYDSIYTERYMQTPEMNPAGYRASSVVKAAKDLRGHLVLLHGSMDDNVHLQNTMQLLWELQRAGKQAVELMVYPRSRHGLHPEVSEHGQEFQWLRLQRLLAPAGK
ncbi:MAG: S9 family peptidase [Planctomycetes bacterium]|nr:S9 family peptidase [Planctomycetota bacterium]